MIKYSLVYLVHAALSSISRETGHADTGAAKQASKELIKVSHQFTDRGFLMLALVLEIGTHIE